MRLYTSPEQEIRLYDVADGEEPKVLSLDKGDDGEKNIRSICIVMPHTQAFLPLCANGG